MKCTNCNYKMEDDALFCPNCGSKKGLEKVKQIKNSKIEEKKEPVVVSESGGSSFGWGVLGFFQPIAGLVLFLAWKDRPDAAKASGIGALVRVIVTAALYIMLIYFSFLALSLEY